MRLRISIVIPCFSAQQYVAHAIQSALAQTYPNCEIIVIDDGSTDGSLEVIKSFGNRIRWETGPKRGACAARNRGIALAQGDYLQFLDADDVIEPEKIERQLSLLQSSDRQMVCGSRWCHFHHCVTEPNRRPSPPMQDLSIEANICDWLIGKSMQFPAMWLIPKTLVKAVGGWDEALLRNQDLDFIARVLLRSDGILFEPNTIAYYRIGNTNSISSSNNQREGKELSQLRSFQKIAEEAASNLHATRIRRSASIAAGLLALSTKSAVVRNTALVMWRKFGGSRPSFVDARTKTAKIWSVAGLHSAMVVRTVLLKRLNSLSSNSV